MSENVFIAYADEDTQMLLKLEKHLDLLKQQGLISIWSHRQIAPGSAKEIGSQLEQASIILLLMSPDFWASDDCHQVKMKRASDLHTADKARVIPIIVRPSDWENGPFADLPALPKTKKPVTQWRTQDEAFSNIVADIRQVVDGKQPLTTKIFHEDQVFGSETSPIPSSIIYKRVLGLLPSVKPPIGRGNLLSILKQQLMDSKNSSSIVALYGEAGVGKTTLAAKLAYDDDICTFFSGGVLWADFGKNPSLNDVLTLWASQLGVDLSSAAALSDKIGRIQYTLGTAPFLLIIDDLWTLEPAIKTFLKIAGPGCGSLVTTRNLEVAHNLVNQIEKAIVVEDLDENAAFTLLITICQNKLTDRGILVSLVKTCGGRPLILELMGAYIYNHLPIAHDKLQIQQFLRKTEAYLRLPGFSVGPRQSMLEKVIDLSIDDLPNRRAKHAFFALGVFAPKPGTFSREAMQHITGADRLILQTLYNRNLLSQSSSGRFMLHYSVADVARSRLHRNDPAWTRHHNYYQEQIKNAISEPGEIRERVDWRTLFYDLPQIRVIRRLQPSSPIFSILVNRLSSSVSWLRWLNSLPIYIKNLLSSILLALLTLLRVSAHHIRQMHIEAFLANYQGRLYAEAEIRDVALRLYECASELWETIGNHPRLAEVQNNIGKVCYMQTQYRQAIKCYHKALKIRRKLNDQ